MVTKQQCDLAVIGAGPGGYVAAIKAAQLGKRVVLIEKGDLGGTCLNVGCIPSKTLLSSAAMVKKIRRADLYGIQTGEVSFDYGKMKRHKDDVVTKIRSGLGGLLKANRIEVVRGTASFLSPKELKIKGEDSQILVADKVIIATGSKPIDIPAFPCDHDRIRNSTSVLELTALPQSVVIIGGGYIGCEFASLFAELDVKVTIVEALPSIVMAQGKTVSQALTAAFQQRGIELKTQAAVASIDSSKQGVAVQLKNGEVLHSELAVVAVGRALNTEGLDLEKAGLTVGKRGEISVNEKMETEVPGIYAIGDITAKAMLAHVASHQGIVAAANACGQQACLYYRAIPAVIFTEPEIATVGLTAEEAQEQGYAVSVGTFPFRALGKAVAAREDKGFAQVISDKKTKEILGAQVVGHEASVLIAEMALAINNELTLDCVIETIHAHPTLPEAWLESALLANETPIHFPPKMGP
ncbi:MAG: dihydrolipoyl dehydrogenase [Chlamydiota bacterium]